MRVERGWQKKKARSMSAPDAYCFGKGGASFCLFGWGRQWLSGLRMFSGMKWLSKKVICSTAFVAKWSVTELGCNCECLLVFLSIGFIDKWPFCEWMKWSELTKETKWLPGNAAVLYDWCEKTVTERRMSVVLLFERMSTARANEGYKKCDTLISPSD